MASPLAYVIANFRETRRKSQEEFGRAIGIAGPNISLIEHGKRYAPPLQNLLPLIDYLDLTAEEISQLTHAAQQSPREIRFAPDAPQELFIFAARLIERLSVLTPKDFDRLGDFVESLGSA